MEEKEDRDFKEMECGCKYGVGRVKIEQKGPGERGVGS